MATLPELTYTGVRVVRHNHVHVKAVIDELAEERIDHAVLLRYTQSNWETRTVESAICGMWPTGENARSLLNVGVDGTVFEFMFPGKRTTQIDASSDGPSHLTPLRVVEGIGDHIYAAGMARQVYRQDRLGRWTRADQGTFVPRYQRTEPCGFLAIGGAREKEIYAAGLKGEIWAYDGSTWTQEDSPTNLALSCIAVMPSGEVCIAGLVGTIVHGRKGGWTIIQHDVTRCDFWGCRTFGGRVYLAGSDGIYVISDKLDTIEPIDLALRDGFTTAYLDAHDGTLWSVGHKDIARSSDGIEWTEVIRPREL